MAAAKRLEKVLLLTARLLLLVMLLLDLCIVRAVHVVHAPLLRIGERLVRVSDALELFLRPRVVFVLVWMIPARRSFERAK